ncbi:hypothetical protein TorRG33x02_136930, partial [Trema orientale]
LPRPQTDHSAHRSVKLSRIISCLISHRRRCGTAERSRAYQEQISPIESELVTIIVGGGFWYETRHEF